MVSRHHAECDHCVQTRYWRRSTCGKVLEDSTKAILVFHCIPAEHNPGLYAPLVRILFESLNRDYSHERSKMDGLAFKPRTFDHNIFCKDLILTPRAFEQKSISLWIDCSLNFRSASPLFTTQKAMYIGWCSKTFGFQTSNISTSSGMDGHDGTSLARWDWLWFAMHGIENHLLAGYVRI